MQDEAGMSQTTGSAGEDLATVLSVLTILLRRRFAILCTTLVAGAIAFGLVVAAPLSYESVSIIQPQGSGSRGAGLAAFASRFGIDAGGTGSEFEALIIEEILKTRSFLERATRDSVYVPVLDPRKISVMAALDEISDSDDVLSTDDAIALLRRLMRVQVLDEIGAVQIEVRSPVPDLATELAELFIEGVNDFNVEQRRSRAANERDFLDVRTTEAELALLQAEDRLLEFVRTNRDYESSPELQLEHDRLSRDVALRQDLYTSLVERLAEARVREVRDTPVITVIEQPTRPLDPSPRPLLSTTAIGLALGFIVACLGAILLERSRIVAGADVPEYREFKRTLDDTLRPWRGRGE
jgi:uncharacterized protein involved in exopolysaccharide biosynthesis